MNGRATVSALPYAIKRVMKDEIYRIYVTDALKSIGENAAALAGGGYISKRYYDLVREDKEAEDERSGDEIAADVISSILGGGDE
jgi:hypothetical protein